MHWIIPSRMLGYLNICLRLTEIALMDSALALYRTRGIEPTRSELRDTASDATAAEAAPFPSHQRQTCVLATRPIVIS